VTAEPFDPTPLVERARALNPPRPELADALAACVSGHYDGPAYVYFVAPDEPGREIVETVRLDGRGGDVLVDLLRDGRVAGVELLYRL
jgi:uncharacterized protein YuzE